MNLSVNSAYEALARFVVRFRWLIVVFWIAMVPLTSALMPSLGSEINGNNSAFLKSSEPSQKAANLAAPIIGGGTGTKLFPVTIVASRAGSPLTSADLAALQRVAALETHVASVHSSKVIGVSADGQAAQIQVRAKLSQSNIDKDKNTIDALEANFSKAAVPAGLKLNVAGEIATAVANQVHSNKQGNQTQMFSILFVIVLLLVVFRSLFAALVTLIPSVLALVISERLIGALGSGGLQISSITQILLIVLMIGAGTDYGLFLVFRVRENLRDGHEPKQAVSKAIVNVGESITGSAGTVILALLTLLFATFGLYHDLAIPLAVGVCVMLLAGLTLQPALLAILGRKAFWPVKMKPEPQHDGVWGTVAAKIVRRPGLTLVIGVLVFGALAVGALGYKAGGFGGATTAPSGSSAAAGNTALAKHFPQTSSNPANLVFAYPQSVYDQPAVIARAQASLARTGRFSLLAGPLNPNGTQLAPADFASLAARLGPPQRLPVREPAALASHVPAAVYDAYRTDGVFVSPDGKTIQFEASLKAGAQDTTAAMNATPEIRAVVSAAAQASGARASGVAGQAAAVYDINHAANHDLAEIIPIAIVAIGLLLAVVLRSAVAPLYLIVSVALSYLASLGVATIVFIDLGGQGGITFILPFLMFVFLLALGEDYNILMMTRIREEAHKLPLREAVIRAIARTGSTITSAGLILGGTFAVFAIVGGSGSGGDQLRAIGFGLAIGILMDTFLVRTLIVPATVMLLGKWNWWPSRLALDDPQPSAPALEPVPAEG